MGPCVMTPNRDIERRAMTSVDDAAALPARPLELKWVSWCGNLEILAYLLSKKIVDFAVTRYRRRLTCSAVYVD